jgi:hypothetical protein
VDLVSQNAILRAVAGAPQRATESRRLAQSAGVLSAPALRLAKGAARHNATGEEKRCRRSRVQVVRPVNVTTGDRLRFVAPPSPCRRCYYGVGCPAKTAGANTAALLPIPAFRTCLAQLGVGAGMVTWAWAGR